MRSEAGLGNERKCAVHKEILMRIISKMLQFSRHCPLQMIENAHHLYEPGVDEPGMDGTVWALVFGFLFVTYPFSWRTPLIIKGQQCKNLLKNSKQLLKT